MAAENGEFRLTNGMDAGDGADIAPPAPVEEGDRASRTATAPLGIGVVHEDFCSCGGVWALCCDNATNYGGSQASEALRIKRAHADFCPCDGVWALCCDNAANYVDAWDGIGAVAT